MTLAVVSVVIASTVIAILVIVIVIISIILNCSVRYSIYWLSVVKMATLVPSLYAVFQLLPLGLTLSSLVLPGEWLRALRH